MVAGKAVLLREDYCDGLGDCLPACPAGAITFEEREAAAYDAEAVRAGKAGRGAPAFGGCPGERSRSLEPKAEGRGGGADAPSRLAQWPCQIKLAPVKAAYFEGAHVLVAASCAAYAYAAMHEALMAGKVTLIGCPKLDGVDYGEKLGCILQNNAIRALTVARMEVPCCGGLTAAVQRALQNSGRQLPVQVVTLSTEGKILPS